jgi:hypothetical protein
VADHDAATEASINLTKRAILIEVDLNLPPIVTAHVAQ